MSYSMIDYEAKLTALRATNAELLAALEAVNPADRNPGCWCNIARDIDFCGHEIGCKMARAAIAKAKGEQS